MNPFTYRITSYFGNRNPININGATTSTFHDGVDFAYPQGTPVTLPPDGEWDGAVLYAGLDQWGGAYVDIRADVDGNISRFLHLSRIDVKKGQRVVKGQQIGLSGGASGTWGAGLSTGPHLHIGLLTPQYRAFDPLPALQKAYTTTVIDPNQLTMSEKKQLTNFYASKDKVITDSRFKELGQDEQNAFGGWDGDDNDASDLVFLAHRILGLREDCTRLQGELEQVKSKPVETEEVKSMSKQTTSSEKKPWESKKFWSLIIGGVGIVVAQTNPELQPVVDELVLTLTTYLAGQSVIDTVNTLK